MWNVETMGNAEPSIHLWDQMRSTTLRVGMAIDRIFNLFSVAETQILDEMEEESKEEREKKKQ